MILKDITTILKSPDLQKTFQELSSLEERTTDFSSYAFICKHRKSKTDFDKVLFLRNLKFGGLKTDAFFRICLHNGYYEYEGNKVYVLTNNPFLNIIKDGKHYQGHMDLLMLCPTTKTITIFDFKEKYKDQLVENDFIAYQLQIYYYACLISYFITSLRNSEGKKISKHNFSLQEILLMFEVKYERIDCIIRAVQSPKQPYLEGNVTNKIFTYKSGTIDDYLKLFNERIEQLTLDLIYDVPYANCQYCVLYNKKANSCSKGKSIVECI